MTIQCTIVGTLGSDFELKWTNSGKAVAESSVAINERRRNSDGDWEDGDTTWVRVTCWELMAENAAESLKKGARVVVSGRMKNRPYEDKEGNKRTSLEMTADEIGPSLRWAVASVTKVSGKAKGTDYKPGEEPFEEEF